MKPFKIIYSNLLKYITNFLNLKTIYRKSVLILFDYLSILTSTLIILFLYSNFEADIISFSLIVSLLAFPLYLWTSQYKPLTRFIKSISIYSIIFRTL